VNILACYKPLGWSYDTLECVLLSCMVEICVHFCPELFAAVSVLTSVMCCFYGLLFFVFFLLGRSLC